jgi:hypothetical protein
MPVTSFTPAQNAPTFASLVYPLRTVTSITTAGNVTYTVAQVLGGKIARDCNGAARTDTLPTAAALVAAVPGAQVGTSFEFDIRNTSGAANTLTVAAGSGGTTSGTMTVAQNNIRFFSLVFTNVTPGSEAYTVYSDGSATF